jgi:hypothetical protein
MAYFVHKQLIPNDINSGDPNWAKRQIWVLKLNANDSIDEFETIEEAKSYSDNLFSTDPTQRIYKVVSKNEDGTFSDVS